MAAQPRRKQKVHARHGVLDSPRLVRRHAARQLAFEPRPDLRDTRLQRGALFRQKNHCASRVLRADDTADRSLLDQPVQHLGNGRWPHRDSVGQRRYAHRLAVLKAGDQLVLAEMQPDIGKKERQKGTGRLGDRQKGPDERKRIFTCLLYTSPSPRDS